MKHFLAFVTYCLLIVWVATDRIDANNPYVLLTLVKLVEMQKLSQTVEKAIESDIIRK